MQFELRRDTSVYVQRNEREREACGNVRAAIELIVYHGGSAVSCATNVASVTVSVRV